MAEKKQNIFVWFVEIFCKQWIWKGFFVNLVYKKFDKWKAWIYLAPTLVLLAIFTIWPIFNTVKMAFTVYWDPEAPIYEYDENGEIVYDDDTGKLAIDGYGMYKGYSIILDIAGETDFEFGFNNFKEILNYDGFFRIMQNTIILCVATVPISTFLALLIAVCLNAIKPLRRFLQTIFFMPYVTNSIAIGMVFAAMFNIVGVNEHNLDLSKSLGIINNILGVFGVDPVNWINQGSGYWANIAVMIIYIVWNALPFKILILLGGLQSVNKQYYEAAKIDSTPPWRVFTRITVPLLSPMITYVVITGFIGGFKEYTSIVGIFGETMQPPGAEIGTPRLQTMVGYIYDKLGDSEGIASAAAILLFILIFAVTLVNLRVSKKNTHY
nr:sugar ABC transporter permease [Oscillospiraceae bacterium]